ncbi:general odorant-binding protein 28a [Vanessa tameamea]|uniref:General odorant-binding protein 28a n=1 Tax=Vanessa tameamea TaxID=334116 RepID=A0ABM4APJ8_VANTA
MVKTFIKFFFYTTILLNLNAMAIDMEELKQQYVEVIMNCAKEFPLSGDDMEKLSNKQMPDNENAKCLFACAYKTSGMMDDQGNLSIEGVNKIADMYLANDPDRLEKAKKFTEACKYVNDVNVSDGNKGCERAALIFKCSIEKAPQFDFPM